MKSLKWQPLALMAFCALFAAFSIVFANIAAGMNVVLELFYGPWLVNVNL